MFPPNKASSIIGLLQAWNNYEVNLLDKKAAILGVKKLEIDRRNRKMKTLGRLIVLAHQGTNDDL